MIENLPILVVLAMVVFAVTIPFWKKLSFRFTLILGGIVLVSALVANVAIWNHVQANGEILFRFGGHLPFLGIEFKIDAFASMFSLFVATLSLLIYLYSSGDKTEGIEQPEFFRFYVLFFLMLFSMYGILFSNDIFNTYVFIEILSLTSCAIVSIKRKKEAYAAAFRYVMLNEIGSLSFLLGIAFLYMSTGRLNIDLLRDALHTGTIQANVWMAVAFFTAGLGLKAAVFPFHIWLPDAYASAPTTSSAMLSSIVSKMYLVILIKVYAKVFGFDLLKGSALSTLLLVLASLGMILGSVYALAQKDLKRMLGYSSVSQIGYVLLGIAFFSEAGLRSAFFHMISHGLTKAALFLAVGIVIYLKQSRSVKGFEGTGFQMPIAMSVFAVAAFSMIGIPLTSGFIAKWNLGIAAETASQFGFLVLIVVSSFLNAMYFLPILFTAFFKDPADGPQRAKPEKIPAPMLVSIGALAVMILLLGIFPDWLMTMIDVVLAGF